MATVKERKIFLVKSEVPNKRKMDVKVSEKITRSQSKRIREERERQRKK